MDKGQRVEIISGQWKGQTGTVAFFRTKANAMVLLDSGDGVNPKSVQVRVLKAV